jgi:hypothetical protein
MGCVADGSDGAERIVSYGARRLAPDEETEFERHVRSCARCRELAEAQQALWSALDEWPGATPSDKFDENLYQRIAAVEQRAWWRRLLPDTWSWRPVAPVALACAALIAAFLLKAPAIIPQSPSPARLQIEQVEHALDDMEMLKQLSVDSQPSHPSERI